MVQRGTENLNSVTAELLQLPNTQHEKSPLQKAERVGCQVLVHTFEH